MPDELVAVTVDDGVALVELNRPEKLNALNAEMRDQLEAALVTLGADKTVRVVILTGRGRAFCAGADLGGDGTLGRTATDAMAAFDASSARQLMTWELPQPVIAAVNGYCLGRGMELALWCDIVVASRTATFGEPEVRDGSFVSSILPWLTSPQQAKLLMLSGDSIDGERAVQLGLATVLADDAVSAAKTLARRLRHVPPPTAHAVKRYVNAIVDGRSVREGQLLGNALGAALRTLSPEDLGTQELVAIREQQGLRAYLKARDEPFTAE